MLGLFSCQHATLQHGRATTTLLGYYTQKTVHAVGHEKVYA